MEHQIWWMRSSIWWSQLPAAIAILAFFAHVSLVALASPSEGWLDTLGHADRFYFHIACRSCGIFFHLLLESTRRTYAV